MIKAVFFDAGGVIVQEKVPGTVWVRTKREAARVLSIPISKVEKYFRSPAIRKFAEGKITELRFWKNLCDKHGKACPHRRKWHPIFRLRGIRLDMTFAKMAGHIRAQGIIAGIISNATPPQAELGRRGGTYHGFWPVILSCVVKVRKPKQRIFLIAAKRAGVRLSEVVFFDDTQHNIDVAKRLGIHAYLYKNAKQVQKVLLEHGMKTS